MTPACVRFAPSVISGRTLENLRKILTAPDIRKRKGLEPLVVVTGYDAAFARLSEMTGVSAILVGDSLGNVVQGHGTTLKVTVEHIIYHSQCVRRGAPNTHIIADMPFMSYQVSTESALQNAGRLIAEGDANSVKLEGGVRSAPAIARIVEAGIPVMGHVGLTPQSIHQFGGYKVQGKETAARLQVMEDAKAVASAGAFAIVLEGVPTALAHEITAELTIPTIGIGAGKYCDGQVLVIYDLLGMDSRFNPKYLKKYVNLEDVIIGAISEFSGEVRDGTFPDEAHSFGKIPSENP